MYLKKLRELNASAEGRAQYLAWLGDPVTQLLIGAIRQMGRPLEPGVVSAESVFMALGKSLGFNGAADLMENPGAHDVQVGEPLVASYGAEARPQPQS
jgi:hypothetical protein